MKIAILICIVAYVWGNEDFRLIDSIIQEKPCASSGGFCTIAADCPKGHLAEKPDLCPTQRQQGVECCHGISLKETRCGKHGGICMKPGEYCNPQVIFDATDCSDNTKCCLLVS